MNILIKGLRKEYGHGFRALDDIDLEIGSGLTGLLGPNGAGKTTLMRILVTLLKPTAGDVKIDGLDLQKNRREIRAMLGYLPQDFSVFSKLQTWEFLDYAAALSGLRSKGERREAVDAMLEKVGLYEVRDRQANKLSGGMKRRLGIAQALIGSPKIVIVDEPTTGLDPEERIRFRNLLSDMARNDIIIILSTHIVGDISSTCRDMALLDRGRVVFKGAPEKLIQEARGYVWQVRVSDAELEVVKEKYPVVTSIPAEAGWDVQIVAEKPDGLQCVPIEANLEHAYVFRMERLGETVSLN